MVVLRAVQSAKCEQRNLDLNRQVTAVVRGASALLLAALVSLPSSAAEELTVKLPEWINNVEIGGMLKMSAVTSSQSAGANKSADELLIAAQVPRDDSEGESNQLRMTARETRFWLKGHDDTTRFHIELDFSGYTPGSLEVANGSAGLRLRHAYTETETPYGRFLFGQTWSTLQNTKASMHKTLYGELPGELVKRIVQARWTGGFNLANVAGNVYVGLESPAFTVQKLDGTLVQPDDDRVPDLALRAELNPAWGNISLAAVARQLRCDMPGECEDLLSAQGVILSGAWRMSAKDELHFQYAKGEGLGRYMGGNLYPEAVMHDDASLTLVDSENAAFSYQHRWSPSLHTAIIYNLSEAKELDTVVGVNGQGAQTELNSLSANIMWWPQQRWRLSAEWLLADSDWTDGNPGGLERWVFSSRYDF
ncbi:DcaP family trimeric outer membrane transporter [Teredinibacter waterburyi]|uniref:DcaP family trimeric outer membrane transporter n=1 Tax=Teredinibacter waterburyi TaxID=1500538 RepID=UPI00165EC53D|nr:DcaP family trimeric outer membrane transporter [Teredinibacter waterburyi]